MEVAHKTFATKKQVENAFDLADKNGKKVKKKLQMLDLSYFIGKNYFDDNGSQNYSTFKSVFKYFQIFSGIVNKILG